MKGCVSVDVVLRAGQMTILSDGDLGRLGESFDVSTPAAIETLIGERLAARDIDLSAVEQFRPLVPMLPMLSSGEATFSLNFTYDFPDWPSDGPAGDPGPDPAGGVEVTTTTALVERLHAGAHA